MFKHPYQDIQSERLLLVVLEEKQYPNSEYRHIRTSVIRRAVPHKMAAKIDSSENCVETWNDDYETKCSGYRVASYVFPKPGTPTFVDDLQLRGQIDEMPRPMRNGKPYGNEIRFSPYMVDQNTARAILDFYTKYNKVSDKNEWRHSEDDYYVALAHLAQFLKIDKIVFHKEGVRHCALSETNCFEEMDIFNAKVRLDKLLAPFLQTPTE